MKFTEKKELRKEILNERNALSQEERCQKSNAIAKRVISLEVFQNAQVMLLYASMRSEVETSLIYEEAKRLGKEIYYPRVLGEVMEFYLMDEATELEESRFGIQEPVPDETRAYVPEGRDDVFVLMPGVVFDKSGGRIGYGGGYYDKYLQWLSGKISEENIHKVAVAYECQMVAAGRIESEPHDIKAEYVVTEDGMYH